MAGLNDGNTNSCNLEALEARLLLSVSISDTEYFGGNNADIIAGSAFDTSENMYIAGYTTSTDLPGVINNGSALDDLFIAKYNNEGTLQWSAYYGGNSYDYARAMAMDSSNNVYVVGTTGTHSLPGASNSWSGSDDAFIVKFNSSGVFQWSRYWGGAGDEEFLDIVIDSEGNPIVTGYTTSSELPGYDGGTSDMILVKYYANGSGTAYSLIQGDPVPDQGNALTLSADGSLVYVASNFTDYGHDWVQIKAVTSEGGVTMNKLITGNGNNYARDIYRDTLGNLYITGNTTSTDLYDGQVAYGGTDAFLYKYTPLNGGYNVAWKKAFGGSLDDTGVSIVLGTNGILSVAGDTFSPDLSGGLNDAHGDSDVLVGMFNGVSGFYYGSVFLGGTLADYATGVRVDAQNVQYVCGSTMSTDYEGAANDYSATGDTTLTKMSPIHIVDPTRTATYVDSGNSTVTVTLKGGGWGFVILGAEGEDCQAIMTESTTLRSSLTVGVRGLSGATTTIKQIDVEGALKGLSGRALFLTEGFYSSDIVVKFQIRGTSGLGQKEIMIGDGAPASLLQISVDLGSVNEVNLASEFAIKSMKLMTWNDLNNDDSITAPFIGMMTSSMMFYCEQITLTSQDLRGQSLKSFKGAYIDDVSITAFGHLGKLTAWEWAGGIITAVDLLSVSITGNLTEGLSGDFLPTLVLTESTPAQLYARSRIAGSHL